MDLIGPYTLRGRDKIEINFMCLTMINPARSLFEVVELPVADHVPTEPVKKDGKTKEAYFDKSSFMISHLVKKCWFSRYPFVKILYMTMEANLNLTSKLCVIHIGLSVSQPASKTHKQMQYWNKYIKP